MISLSATKTWKHTVSLWGAGVALAEGRPAAQSLLLLIASWGRTARSGFPQVPGVAALTLCFSLSLSPCLIDVASSPGSLQDRGRQEISPFDK